jgi:hypothetical protein
MKYQDPHDFYEQQEPDVRNLLSLLREVLTTADPHLRETMKYNTAFYVRKSWVCYIGKVRRTGVEIGFPRGKDMSNEHGLLQIKDRKAILGIHFADVSDFEAKYEIFMEILQEALLLDDVHPRSAAAELLSGKRK